MKVGNDRVRVVVLYDRWMRIRRWRFYEDAVLFGVAVLLLLPLLFLVAK